jgi:hypothetical protein
MRPISIHRGEARMQQQWSGKVAAVICALALGATGGVAAGCDDNDDEGPAEEAGQAVDEAGDEAGEAIEDADQEVGEDEK